MLPVLSFFFFNDTATTEIYTLSLHDALPISSRRAANSALKTMPRIVESAPNRIVISNMITTYGGTDPIGLPPSTSGQSRSEEHTSELQSRLHLVCRLLLEKKKKLTNTMSYTL